VRSSRVTPFTLDPWFDLVALIPSAVGGVLLFYGRKTHRIPHVVGGILLMACPYAVDTTFELVGIGVAIGVGVWAALRLGW
jgi:hypothetical protein